MSALERGLYDSLERADGKAADIMGKADGAYTRALSEGREAALEGLGLAPPISQPDPSKAKKKVKKAVSGSVGPPASRIGLT